jgi:hydrogenase-4 component E
MMPVELVAKVINLISFLVVGIAILLIVRRDLAGQVRLFSLQSLVLSGLAITIATYAGSIELLVVGVVLAIVKVVIVPRVMRRAVRKIGLEQAVSPYLGTAPALVVCGLLVMIAFYVMAPITASNPLPTAGATPLAFAAILIGFFVTLIRRRALTQILGFLMLENGIFLLALLITYGVPFIVEVGVFLDLLVAVLIMEIFVYRIKENFDSNEVRQMRKLKG